MQESGISRSTLIQIRVLGLQHSRLDNRIREEVSRPNPDALLIKRYMRIRLRLKDEMADLLRLGSGRPKTFGSS